MFRLIIGLPGKTTRRVPEEEHRGLVRMIWNPKACKQKKSRF
jgi:hypothetical protein